jgi:5-methylcytosine-specific restriction endonuclease McrA
MGTRHGASALSSNAECDWVHAHAALSRLAQERAALDVEEGHWLLCAWRSSAHVHVGYASFSEYIGRLFGYSARTTQEKLRVAEALETMPRLASALEAGALSWCAAREVTRVAVVETEQAWLDAARGRTVRELEALVASRAPGDAPDAPAAERLRPRVLRFEVAADTFATFREAMQQVRRSADGGLDDDAVLLAMARKVLGGPRDEGRSSYQISLSVCEACGGGAQSAAGERVPVDAAVVAMAACDAQQLGELLPRAAGPRAANENASLHGVSAAPHQSSDHAHVGALNPRGNEVATDTTALRRAAATQVRSNSRAKQTIPPALRRAVLTRDRRRCRVPGCTHATFVDVHHVQPRSEGGRNEASNLLVLCSAHHRAVHRGELLIERDHEGAFRFRHVDGAAYGDPITPRLIDAHAKVFSALRHLGFRECEVKAVLAELRADAELSGASVERLLREALRRIKPLASVKKGR